jgi:hypothetical protein
VGMNGGVDVGALGTNGSSGVDVIARDVVDSRCGIFAPIYKF